MADDTLAGTGEGPEDEAAAVPEDPAAAARAAIFAAMDAAPTADQGE